MTDNTFIERQIIIGLITDSEFLRRFARDHSSESFSTSAASTIADWCIEYYEEYERAPGQKDFETLFMSRSSDLPKSEKEDLMDILASLSRDYEKAPVNSDFLFQEAKVHFDTQKILALSESLQKTVLRNNGTTTLSKQALEQALGEIEKFKSDGFKLKDATLIDPLAGLASVKRAFRERPEPLIEFVRALGAFINDQLVRDAFVAFLAAEKKGKSWLLEELGLRGAQAGHNVAIFQAGDMSEAQQLVRTYMRISGKPAPLRVARRDEEDELEGEMDVGRQIYWIPTLDCVKNICGTCPYNDRIREDPQQSAMFTVEEWGSEEEEGTLAETMKERITQSGLKWQACTACKDEFQAAVSFQRKETTRSLDVKTAYKAVTKWKKQYKGNLRIATYVNETLTVSEIRRQLDEWEREEGKKADIVIIDYADLLAPDEDYKRLEWRHQINKTWQRLRALSEQRKCLVITATQAAATSYDKPLLRLSDFSEDKRKYAHCTAMYGLNQTMDEKKFGILRLNQLVIREGDFNVQNQVHILQCLAIGRPILGSY